MSTDDTSFLDSPTDGGVDFVEDLPDDVAPKKGGGSLMKFALIGGGVFLLLLAGFAGLVIYPKYQAQQEARKRPFTARPVEPLPPEPASNAPAPKTTATPETITPQPANPLAAAPPQPAPVAPAAAPANADANLPPGFTPMPAPPATADNRVLPSAPDAVAPPPKPVAATPKAPPLLDDRLVAKVAPKPLPRTIDHRPVTAKPANIPGTRLPDHVDIESARLDEWKPMD